MNYKVVDLFAGAGGLSLGFLQTESYQIVAAAECNKSAATTYNENIFKSEVNNVIKNVIGFDYSIITREHGNIDVVIGGPPCQGFSNANRQKRDFISANNSLVKEFFRAVDELNPKAFIMENVAMLMSDIHKFYVTQGEKEFIRSKTINLLNEEIIVFNVNCDYDEMMLILESPHYVSALALNKTLLKHMEMIRKYENNESRLSKYIDSHRKYIIRAIDDALKDISSCLYEPYFSEDITTIKNLSCENKETYSAITRILELQDAIWLMKDIFDNNVFYEITEDLHSNEIKLNLKTYLVSDYIHSFVADKYEIIGKTLNSKWFGVPQDRSRYITMGIRKDIARNQKIELPKEPSVNSLISVEDAIMDIASCKTSFDKSAKAVSYNIDPTSEYAIAMRGKEKSLSNHVITNTTATALERFKEIEEGKNFHSLPKKLTTTYENRERTQNTIYLRLDRSKLSPTVINARKSMWIHPTEDRAISIREVARLQSFPDWFVFEGSKDSQYQQIGNAVPPLMAEGVARNLLKYL